MPAGRPLRLWLAWRFALIASVPLLLVAALLLWVLLPQAVRDVENHHQALARAISGQVAVHLRGAQRELAVVAAFLQKLGDQPAPAWFEPVLDAHVGGGEVFAAIYVAAADDSVYAVGLPEERRSLRAKLLEIDRARAGVVREARVRQAPVWSEVDLSVVSAGLAVSLAIPVGDRVLVGEVAIDRLSEFLKALPNAAGVLTMIVDRRGQVIAHSQSRRGAAQLNLGHLPIVAGALQGRFDRHTLELDGEQFLADVVSVPQLGWMVLVAQPRSDALGSFRSTWWALAAGALVALLLAIGVSLVLAHRFAQRLGRYTAQAHAFAEGDYDPHWPISNIREFDSLAGDLDRMSQAIRHRQHQLACSEARFRSVISNAPVAIFQFDELGVVQLCEGKGLAAAGLLPGQAVGRSLFALYRDYPEICSQARRAIHGEAVHFISQFAEVTFDTYFNPVRDADGGAGVIGVAVDISERMRAEEGLRQANLVVENSPAMLFRWRAEEGWPTVFVSHNVKQLGYSLQELLEGATPFASLIHPDDLERVAREVQACSDNGSEHFEQEYRILTRDGATRWVDDHTAIERNAHGQVTHYQGIVIDISERKRAEMALSCANRQLRMISECSQALIRTSHEIDLLNAVCRIVVEVGGYRMAWVAACEDDRSPRLRPVAQAGNAGGGLDGADSDGAIAGEAIRSGRPCLIQDLANDPRYAPWRARAAAHGHAALCTLPLQAGGRTLGALSIYAAVAGVFDANEVALLSELAGDLAFGITALRTRSERDQADVALHESEARYRLLFDRNPHPMWLCDRETLAFLTVNDAAINNYGYSKEEFLRMTLLDLSPGEETPLLSEDVIAVEERGDYAGFGWHRRKDGSMIDVDIVAHALSFQGRQAELVLADDITERKRAEQALLQSELKYRELVENANSIILRLSPQGRITFINEFGLKFFGYAEEELLGRQVLGTIIPHAAGKGSSARPATLEDLCHNPAGLDRGISENMRRGGERVWVAWTNKAIFDDGGRLLEVFSVGSDVTERKRVEDELQRYRDHLEELVAERTAELRQAMTQLVQAEKLAALGNLVAGVAHELNTPLGNTRLVASLLAGQLREFANALEAGTLRRAQVDGFLSRSREAVDLLERNSARAADLIGHFKQVAVDQSSARRRSFDLRQTVDEMLLSLRLTFKHTRHRIEVDIPAGLEMDSYPGPLEQVIANLVANSLGHGFVGIDEGLVELQAQAVDETRLLLRYVDNGVGIASGTVHRVFEPFFTTRLGRGGSGLGLYIVYNLVTGVLGGTIEVASSPGHGVSFTLTLPRRAPQRTATY
ncbi:MAG: PAS domain S-box protein [Candidatus Accumulibacter sp.]|nr:PAS domain S-box protein [Accumulibacter sp.]